MFQENLAIFFNDFSISIAFTRSATPVCTAKLILDSPSLEQAIYDRSFYDEKFYEARVKQHHVILLGIASEVASVQLNDVATVNGQTWYVIDIAPDGTGLVAIQLSANSV